jgi:hypothetical protein
VTIDHSLTNIMHDVSKPNIVILNVLVKVLALKVKARSLADYSSG